MSDINFILTTPAGKRRHTCPNPRRSSLTENSRNERETARPVHHTQEFSTRYYFCGYAYITAKPLFDISVNTYSSTRARCASEAGE